MSWLATLLACLAPDDPMPAGTDTGLQDGLCPLEVAPLAMRACAETTADVGSGTAEFYDNVEYRSSGLVTEVGGVLEPVPGSERLNQLVPCDDLYSRQVRLVDDNGDTWTFGWYVEGSIADDSTAAINPGSELDFYVIWELLGYSYQGALLLSDDVGPLFLFELQPMLTDTDRGGVAVDIDYENTCRVDSPYDEDDQDWDHFLVTFSWAGGEVALRSGGTARLPVQGRELELVLGQSRNTICTDSCGNDEWAAWAEAP